MDIDYRNAYGERPNLPILGTKESILLNIFKRIIKEYYK